MCLDNTVNILLNDIKGNASLVVSIVLLHLPEIILELTVVGLASRASSVFLNDFLHFLHTPLILSSGYCGAQSLLFLFFS